MKYEELKEQILKAVEESGKFSLMALVVDYFQRYEKESAFVFGNGTKEIKNKASEMNIEKEIFELSCFRKKFGECLDNQRNDLSLLKKHILELQDELLTLKRDLKFEKEQEKPKQERFYSEIIGSGEEKYIIIDREEKIKLDCIFYALQAHDICRALNQMEGGK